VAAARERRTNVGQRWLAGGWIECGDFGDDFGFGAIQEFFNRRGRRSEFGRNGRAVVAISSAVTRRMDSHDREWICVALPIQEMRKSAAHVAVSDESDPQEFILAADEWG
jgi:hypothetical protein